MPHSPLEDMQNAGEQQLQSAVKPCCCCAGSMSFWLVPCVSMRDRQTAQSSTCWEVIQGVGFKLLEPPSEQGLCKSGVSALVTRELSQGSVGFVQLGEMVRLYHSDREIWLHPSVRMAPVPSLDTRSFRPA